jgi:hypothetical protein
MSEKKPMNRSDYVAPQEKRPVDASLNAPSHDEIARLAHAIWEARGGGDGGALDDWLGAERLLQEHSRKGQAA